MSEQKINKGFGFDILDRSVDQLPKNVTAGVLADLLGLTTKRISNMVNAGKMPSEGHNKYNLKRCVNAYIDSVRTTNSKKKNDFEKAKIEKIRRENKIAAKQLIDINIAGQAIMSLASIVTDQLESFAPRVSADIAPVSDISEVQGILHEETRRIREYISREIENSGLISDIS